MQNKNENHTPSGIHDVSKTALYYEYTSVNVKEDHIIEKTLTALLKDPDVLNDNIRKVTYYLVQKYFIKSANEKKENIDLISQIPGALKKIVDTVPADKTDKKMLVKFLNLYLSHTISTQEDQVKLFEGYNKVLKQFLEKLAAQENIGQKNILQNKEVIIDQTYQYIDTIKSSINVTKESSRVKADKKIDQWVNKIYENHVIEKAFDVIIALEDYCLEEMNLSKERVGILKKYSKLNAEKIAKEILENPDITTIKDGWPIISENIFIYIDNLTKEHGDYKKILEEVFTPLKEDFVDYFFSHFFLISAYQAQTEKDIYLLEKTLKDLHLIKEFKNFFTSQIQEEIEDGEEKSYCIENFFQKVLTKKEGPHKNTFTYLTLKYLLEKTLEKLNTDNESEKSKIHLYQKAFHEFIKPKYPKFLDSLIFIYLKQSKELEKKVGNTKKRYSNIFKKDTSLLKDLLRTMGLVKDYDRIILPIITGIEQGNQILKNN